MAGASAVALISACTRGRVTPRPGELRELSSDTSFAQRDVAAPLLLGGGARAPPPPKSYRRAAKRVRVVAVEMGGVVAGAWKFSDVVAITGYLLTHVLDET